MSFAGVTSFGSAPEAVTDLQSMGCMELKKHLLTLGVPREELDACDGKDALLHLWECQQGATAELDDQIVAMPATVEVSLFNCMSIERGRRKPCD